MSGLRLKSGENRYEDYPEAAKKHLGDAKTLLKEKRFDGAAYHAGYVVECVLRSLLLVIYLDPRIKQLGRDKWKDTEVRKKLLHNAKTQSGVYNDSAMHDLRALQKCLDDKCQKHSDIKDRWQRMGDQFDWKIYKWHVADRYEGEGAISESNAKQYVENAELLYKKTWASLADDGVLNAYL